MKIVRVVSSSSLEVGEMASVEGFGPVSVACLVVAEGSKSASARDWISIDQVLATDFHFKAFAQDSDLTPGTPVGRDENLVAIYNVMLDSFSFQERLDANT